MRLKYDASKGKDVAEELKSREAQAAKMVEKGYVPSAGVVVFNQLDKKKTREISKEQLQELLTALKVESKSVEEIMTRLDVDENGTVSETEWLQGLDRCQDLKAALEADIEPSTGMLKSMPAGEA
jgi:fructose-bisphosphate aldolase class 1